MTETVTISVDELRRIVAETVQKSLKQCAELKCPIPEEAREEMSHWFGMIKDVGDGRMEKGVEKIRLNHLFIESLRETMTSTAKKIYYLIIAALLTGLGTLIVLGVHHFIEKSGK